jgi:hypothetical protein
MSSTERLRPHRDVVDTEIDSNETVLLHLGSKVYFSLNSTGSRIWNGMKKGLTGAEISSRLQEEFDVDAQHADDAVAGLIEQLKKQQLVEIAPGQPS